MADPYQLLNRNTDCKIQREKNSRKIIAKKKKKWRPYFLLYLQLTLDGLIIQVLDGLAIALHSEGVVAPAVPAVPALPLLLPDAVSLRQGNIWRWRQQAARRQPHREEELRFGRHSVAVADIAVAKIAGSLREKKNIIINHYSSYWRIWRRGPHLHEALLVAGKLVRGDGSTTSPLAASCTSWTRLHRGVF